MNTITDEEILLLADKFKVIQDWKEFGIDCSESTDMKKCFLAGFKAALSQNKVSDVGAVEIIEDLLDAVPKQDNDHDWWPDDLTAAVKNAKKFLEDKPIDKVSDAVEFGEWLRTFDVLEKGNGYWVLESQISTQELYEKFKSYPIASTSQFEKYEIEPCECGHTVPLEFIVYDNEGCGTCLNCFRDLLVYKLEKEKNISKKLRKKLKSLQLNK